MNNDLQGSIDLSHCHTLTQRAFSNRSMGSKCMHISILYLTDEV